MNTHPSFASPLARFPAMWRWSPLLSVAAVLAACGEDPPSVCGAAIPQQELYVPETTLLAPCFEGETLELSAMSSDGEISTVAVLGQAIAIKAVSPGTNTITVTARDPGGQSASLDIQVLVPNQSPIASGKVKTIRMMVEGRAVREVGGFFDDPDGQDLAFSALSMDASIAGAEIDDSGRLLVTGQRLGKTIVTVTATDPGGLTATREVDVHVLDALSMVHEDFDDGNTGGFIPNYASRQLSSDGHLRLTNRYAWHWGWTQRHVKAAEWDYTASVAQEEGVVEPSVPGLGSYNASGAEPLIYLVFFGDIHPDNRWGVNGNYMMVHWAPDWKTEGSFWGESEAIAEVGEFTEVNWTARGGEMTVTAGSTLLIEVDLVARGWTTEMARMMIMTYPHDGMNRYGRVDRVELNAIPDEDVEDLADHGDWHVGPPELEVPGIFASKRGVDIPVEILR